TPSPPRSRTSRPSKARGMIAQSGWNRSDIVRGRRAARSPGSRFRSILAVLGPAVVGDPVLRDLVVHDAAGHAQQLGRLLLDPVAALERFQEGLFLEQLEVEQARIHQGRHVAAAVSVT